MANSPKLDNLKYVSSKTLSTKNRAVILTGCRYKKLLTDPSVNLERMPASMLAFVLPSSTKLPTFVIKSPSGCNALGNPARLARLCRAPPSAPKILVSGPISYLRRNSAIRVSLLMKAQGWLGFVSAEKPVGMNGPVAPKNSRE